MLSQLVLLQGWVLHLAEVWVEEFQEVLLLELVLQ